MCGLVVQKGGILFFCFRRGAYIRFCSAFCTRRLYRFLGGSVFLLDFVDLYGF